MQASYVSARREPLQCLGPRNRLQPAIRADPTGLAAQIIALARRFFHYRPMQKADVEAILQPVLTDVHERATVANRFIDKDQYQIYMATLWANMVLNPSDINLEQSDLEGAHDVLNAEISRVLGAKHDLTECYRYLNSKSGEKAMQAARLNQSHKDMLLYFASMILDPDGHKRWLDEIKKT